MHYRSTLYLPSWCGILALASALHAQSNTIVGRNIGLENTWALTPFTRGGSIFPNGASAFGAWTTCCNPGTNNIPFQAAMSPSHGFIHYMMVRESDGRFVQISNRGFVKHTFGSSNDPSTCGSCAGPGNINFVEVGCSDTYSASQAVDHFHLGPPDEIDPWLGRWTSLCSVFDRGDPEVAPAELCDNTRSLTHTQAAPLNVTIHNQMHVTDADLNVAGATFWYQSGYLIPQEAESLRGDNIGSRQFTPTWAGATWSIADGPTFLQGTILQRWTGASLSSNSNGTFDGRYYVAVKVTGPTNGLWHYEYAVHNRDNKRGLGALRIPICATAQASNFGFHDVDQDPLNQWSANVVAGEIVFSTSGSPANPLKWNSIFNFWFDCDAAPVPGTSLALDQHAAGLGSATVLVTSTTPGGLFNENLGPGCGNPTAPTLFAIGAPDRATLGNTTFALRSNGNPAGAVCAFGFSLVDGTTLAGPGCTIYAADIASMQPMFLVTADVNGVVNAALPIPSSTVFEGLHLDMQEVNIDASGALLSAFNLSNGLRLRIGNLIANCP